MVRGAIGEQAENGRRIHGVDVALDDPLISSEAQVLGRKQFRGSPFSILLDNAEMQVSMRIDGDVGGISGRDTGHVSAREFPGTSSPRDRLGVSALQCAEQDTAKHRLKN